MLFYFQRALHDADQWLARERDREAATERCRAAAVLREVREEAADNGCGLVGLLTLVNHEERDLTQGYLMAWAMGVLFWYLPPVVFISYWVILPQEQIPAVYRNVLLELFSHWDSRSAPRVTVHTGHVLSHHQSLRPLEAMPINILNDGSLSVISLKGRFLLSLSTPCRISALGYILARIGRVVCWTVQTVRGQATVTLAVRLPFTVGWWFTSSITNFLYFAVVINIYHKHRRQKNRCYFLVFVLTSFELFLSRFY